MGRLEPSTPRFVAERYNHYESFSGLSKEIKSKLTQIKPKTLGQALRIDGVTPAAAIILLGYIKKSRYKASA